MSPTLAERAMACKRWRWLGGMLSTDGSRCGYVTGGVPVFGYDYDDAEAVPDLDDPLTVLALLLLVQEAYGCPGIYLGYDGSYAKGKRGQWFVSLPDGRIQKHTELGDKRGDTPAEVLVAVLECAP